MQNAEEQFGNQFSLSGSKNEFDYLKSTYSNIINHQEELVTIFPLIYDSVAEKVFHDLFFDYETPSAELAGRLDMLSEKFRYYQRFRVILAVPERFSEEFNSRMPQLSQKISALPEALNKISICPKNDLGIIVGSRLPRGSFRRANPQQHGSILPGVKECYGAVRQNSHWHRRHLHEYY